MYKNLLGLTLGVGLALPLHAELTLPAVFSDHMVLQQKQANPVWGWDRPGTVVTVRFGEKTYTAEAGQDGKWLVKLAPAAANPEPATLSVQGTSSVEIRDVLVGEVW